MYAITYKRNNLTITIKADIIERVIESEKCVDKYDIYYSGYKLELKPEDILTIRNYKSRESKRGNCTR